MKATICPLVAVLFACSGGTGAESIRAVNGAAKQEPYGMWKSSLSAKEVANKSVRLSDPQVSSTAVYWLEARPVEDGRIVVVRWTGEDGATDLLPPGFSARTRAHGYGGGAFVVADSTVYFTNDDDKRIYSVTPDGAPKPITGDSPRDWFADLVVDRARNRLLAIRERLPDEGAGDGAEPVDALVAIAIDSGAVTELHSGPDFISSPRLSIDGTRLAFVTWEHPHMPWDTTTLWQARVAGDGTLASPVRVAGGDRESVTQPRWTASGALMFVSDRTQWWNLYLASDGSVAPVFARAAEFTYPPWKFGSQSYALAGEQLIASFAENGRWFVADLTSRERPSTSIGTQFSAVSGVSADGHVVVFAGASPTLPTSIVRVDLKSGLQKILRAASKPSLNVDAISHPEPIEFPTADGATSHAFYYPPLNPAYRAPAGTKPPLIVKAHGGPSGAASPTLNLRTQYWTSRGFAVVDVNYRGSSGYGRAYREALYEEWGKADVEDLAAAVRFLAKRGDIDPSKVAITGGSAGGFSVLNALIHHREFVAGAAYYSISDLELLAKETHKFESRYLDQLVGPYPETKARYRERSPINHFEKLDKPLVLFHGLLDKVVPVNQAKLLHKALIDRGVASELYLYEDEGHGFRRSQNIADSLEAEHAFYARVFRLSN